MTARNNAPGDRTLKPGPGAHRPELVRKDLSGHFDNKNAEPKKEITTANQN